MESKEDNKFSESIKQLDETLKVYNSKKERGHADFLAPAKAFEIAVEYGWRELKRRVEDEGLDAPSPKAAVRQAARIGIITAPEKWLDCINARNDSVHDYFCISEKEYIDLAESFVVLAKNL